MSVRFASDIAGAAEQKVGYYAETISNKPFLIHIKFRTRHFPVVRSNNHIISLIFYQQIRERTERSVSKRSTLLNRKFSCIAKLFPIFTSCAVSWHASVNGTRLWNVCRIYCTWTVFLRYGSVHGPEVCHTGWILSDSTCICRASHQYVCTCVSEGFYTA